MFESGQDRKIAALRTSNCVCFFIMCLGDSMNEYMKLALKEAEKSLKHGDVPVGAVIVENGKVISKAHNKKEKYNNVVKHAEIIALEKACRKKKNWHLNDCEMYVTLEPCMMCFSAINQARIKKVYYALKQNKKNVLDYTEIKLFEGGEESQKLLNNFFITKRK